MSNSIIQFPQKTSKIGLTDADPRRAELLKRIKSLGSVAYAVNGQSVLPVEEARELATKRIERRLQAKQRL